MERFGSGLSVPGGEERDREVRGIDEDPVDLFTEEETNGGIPTRRDETRNQGTNTFLH